MTNLYARQKKTGNERPLLFVPELSQAQRLHLPEVALSVNPLSNINARKWRTVRLRPEVLAMIEGLRARTRRHYKDELTISETLAAVLLTALPEVVRKVPFMG